ncbi:MAG: DeoR/GlpR transcriptional regulator [Lachnospiraceae bacterium]|nr:DeoR/GlpR transcriptional regulator [Lachnospiraceae bacterium]
MLQCQRQEEILAKLEQQKTMNISTLAKELFFSEATIRRDLNALEKLGLVKRVYGGVILSKYASSTDLPLSLREHESRPQKDLIASKAAELLHDGATILMDASSTVQHMIPYLKDYANLTVITNSMKVIDQLEGTDVRVFCTGGHFIARNRAFAGAAAINMLNDIYADYLFFSAQGISLSGEISDFSEEETALRKVMMTRATKSYFLCDHSKIGQSYLFKLCDSTDVDGIICNTELPETIRVN